MEKPKSVKIISWLLYIKLTILILFVVMGISLFFSGGEEWESFKRGFLENSVGISASEYNSFYFGNLIGVAATPLSLTIISLIALSKKMYKIFLIFIILQFILAITTPLHFLLMVVILIFALLGSTREYFNKEERTV
jgi:hypothetical protein